MTKDKIHYLLHRYLSQEMSEEEFNHLFQALEKEEDQKLWEEVFEKMIQNYPPDADYDSDSWEELIQAILKEGQQPEVVEKKWQKRKMWFRAAASLLLLMGLGAWFFYNHTEVSKDNAESLTFVNQEENQIKPGGNKAILQLATGQNIILDSLPNGQLSVGGNAQIQKIDGGKIAYKGSGKANGKVQYNRLITPRGGQYQLVLPDGSKVWLNAESSIRYPTHFTKMSRKVKISGEAYFEVNTDVNRPFIVQVDEMEVKVLGTRFNINSYKNESSVNTTLIDGAVEVVKEHQKIQLQPGQQAQLSEEGKLQVVEVPNLDKVVAWKNGLFYFDQDEIEYAMRKIDRWYNIEVHYDGPIPKGHITGKIPRKSEIKDVLEIMKLSGVQFKVGSSSIDVRAEK